jgi:hypothetical protein
MSEVDEPARRAFYHDNFAELIGSRLASV